MFILSYVNFVSSGVEGGVLSCLVYVLISGNVVDLSIAWILLASLLSGLGGGFAACLNTSATYLSQVRHYIAMKIMILSDKKKVPYLLFKYALDIATSTLAISYLNASLKKK